MNLEKKINQIKSSCEKKNFEEDIKKSKKKSRPLRIKKVDNFNINQIDSEIKILDVKK